MRIDITDRILKEAKYVIANNATIRDTGKYFGIAKSTIHKDLSEKLYSINNILANEVNEILEKNKSERHIRGGIATKNKYNKMKEEIA